MNKQADRQPAGVVSVCRPHSLAPKSTLPHNGTCTKGGAKKKEHTRTTTIQKDLPRFRESPNSDGIVPVRPFEVSDKLSVEREREREM